MDCYGYCNPSLALGYRAIRHALLVCTKKNTLFVFASTRSPSNLSGLRIVVLGSPSLAQSVVWSTSNVQQSQKKEGVDAAHACHMFCELDVCSLARAGGRRQIVNAGCSRFDA